MFEGCGGLDARMDLREDFARPPGRWRNSSTQDAHVAESKAFTMYGLNPAASRTPGHDACHQACLARLDVDQEAYCPGYKPVIGSISYWSCIISVPSAGNREHGRQPVSSPSALDPRRRSD
jgi:hypothetical protein